MNEELGNLIYLVLLFVLIASSLMARRLPFGKLARMAVAWIAIFGTVFVVFTYRTEFRAIWNRVQADVGHQPITQGDGSVRLNKAVDGHFWVVADVNGRSVRFMIDSGATTTSISRATAEQAGLDETSAGFPVVVETANGVTQMRRGRVARLSIGPIIRRDLPVLIADDMGDLNLLGMNFLSSLRGWRIDGDVMVLEP